jgi:hypothetical protein
MVDLCRGPSSHPHFSSQFIPIFQSIALTDSGNIHRFLFSVFGNQHLVHRLKIQSLPLPEEKEAFF